MKEQEELFKKLAGFFFFFFFFCLFVFFGGAGIKTMLKYRNTSFLRNHMILYLTTSVSNNLDYLHLFFFGEKESVFEKFQLVKWY